jgi:aminoglycoside phosphotransferase
MSGPVAPIHFREAETMRGPFDVDDECEYDPGAAEEAADFSSADVADDERQNRAADELYDILQRQGPDGDPAAGLPF